MQYSVVQVLIQKFRTNSVRYNYLEITRSQLLQVSY